MVLSPKIYRPGVIVNDQHTLFNKSSARAPTMSQLQALLAAVPEPEVVEELAADEGEVVEAWSALEIHPKLGSLFLHAPKMAQAVGIFADVYQVVPDADKRGLDALANFLRTAGVGDAGVSRLSRGWVRVVPGEDEALEEWCGAMKEAYTQKPPPAPTEAVVERRIVELADRDTKEKADNLGRKYSAQELNDLFVWCGLEPADPENLETTQLPTFLIGLEGVRAKQAPLRRYVETFLHSWWPKDQPSFQFFLSPELIKAIGSLNFFGHDAACRWSQKHLGLSVFALYPLSDGRDPGARRSQALAFALLGGYHFVNDAEAEGNGFGGQEDDGGPDE